MSGPGTQPDPLVQMAEEFAERYRRGERPALSEYTARHPELAEQIRDLFPALVVMEEFGSVDGPAAPPGPDDGPVPPQLGDYRLLREVGRGGMGVVYEAVQVSLGRRVALKVLPFAAGLDAKQLQRFTNEAHAVAQLHHTNVVPVFGVGCERGVHFYAMQFIEGQTLASLIRELRQLSGKEVGEPGPAAPAPATPPIAALSTEHSVRSPAYFQTVARLGVQAAEGLEHAHQAGAVHRDVKPANLLVDVRGNLWVTDFGLAQIQGDPRLTLTGDLVGTLRYMSPEQALAKRVGVDHRTDVYSLGTTLYELLALQPAFGGSDRQELLRQIAFDEPVPPRRLNRAVPAELETVVLKAMAKTPAERYATAQELADDLRRFLEDRPIRARRPSLLQRLTKWARRHKGVAWSAGVSTAVLLVAAVVGLALANRRIAQEEALTRKALMDAEANYNLAAEQRQAARANFQKARDVVDKMLTRLGGDLAHQPRLEKTRRDILQEALAFYQGFLQESGSDPEVRRETAGAHFRVGEIHRLLGQRAEAVGACAAAAELWRGLAADWPAEAEYREQQALCHNCRGLDLHVLGRLPEAEEALRQAVALEQCLADEFPHEPRYRLELAGSRNNLGLVLKAVGHLRDAERTFRQVSETERQLAAEFPKVPNHRQLLASALNNLGSILQMTGPLPEAEAMHQEAVRVRQGLVADFPAEVDYQLFLTKDYANLGNLLSWAGRLPEAEDVHRRAGAILAKLVADFPDTVPYRQELAFHQNQLGAVQSGAGRLAEAEKSYREALALYRKLFDELPQEPLHRRDWAHCLENLGRMLAKAGRPEEAERAHREALTLRAALMERFPQAWRYRRDLALSQSELGNLLRVRGRYSEALLLLRQAVEARQRFAEEHPEAASYQSELGAALHNLALCEFGAEERESARRHLEQALARQKAALQADPQNPAYRRYLRNHYDASADTLLGLGRHGEAAAVAEELARVFPDAWRDTSRAAKQLAHCAIQAREDRQLSEAERDGLSRSYGRRAAEVVWTGAGRHRNNPAVQRAAAWFLAAFSDSHCHDVGRAVELAQRAVELAPADGPCRRALGVAHYRAADWNAAVAALEKANAFSSGGDCAAQFFLAMVCWRLGQKDRAGQWYDQAVRSMESQEPPAGTLPDTPQLQRFRAEAEALLKPGKP